MGGSIVASMSRSSGFEVPKTSIFGHSNPRSSHPSHQLRGFPAGSLPLAFDSWHPCRSGIPK
jgi:hypothetical protein